MTKSPKPGVRRAGNDGTRLRRVPAHSTATTRPASAPISGFHAHIYFHDTRQRRIADHLCRELMNRFGAEFGMRRESPGGPHPAPMVQLAFGAAMFGILIPFLMLSRKGLDVLVHPVTGADRADHEQHALWLGQKLAINFDAL